MAMQYGHYAREMSVASGAVDWHTLLRLAGSLSPLFPPHILTFFTHKAVENEVLSIAFASGGYRSGIADRIV